MLGPLNHAVYTAAEDVAAVLHHFVITQRGQARTADELAIWIVPLVQGQAVRARDIDQVADSGGVLRCVGGRDQVEGQRGVDIGGQLAHRQRAVAAARQGGAGGDGLRARAGVDQAGYLAIAA